MVSKSSAAYVLTLLLVMTDDGRVHDVSSFLFEVLIQYTTPVYDRSCDSSHPGTEYVPDSSWTICTGSLLANVHWSPVMVMSCGGARKAHSHR